MFMYYIICIELLFKSIIPDGPFVPMTADSKLASLFGKLKYEENLIDIIYLAKKKKSLSTATLMLTSFISSSIVQDFQDIPDDEENRRSIKEYMNDLEEEFHERALLAKSKSTSQQKPKLRPTKDFKAKYNKVKAKLALLNFGASTSKSLMVKNNGLVAKAYEWDEEDVSSDDNEMVEVKVLMTLADDENVVVGKEISRNGEWVKISMRKDFQDSPDDEEDTRTSHEYLNELVEEYQARALLAKSKIFFKMGTYRFSSGKVTDQTECHKRGKKGHFARYCWSRTSVPSYQSPFQSKLLLSFKNKPQPRQTKDFKAKYHKVKAKLALFSSSASTPSSSLGKTKVSFLKRMIRVMKKCQINKDKATMALIDEERVLVGKEITRNGDWTKISMKKVHTLLEMEDNDDRKSFIYILMVPSNESQRNIIHPLVVVSDSSTTDYDLADESLVCSTPLLSIKKLDGVEPVSGPKTIKSVLKLKSTFKAKTLKGITINEPSSAPTRGKSSLASKTNSATASKLKNKKIEDEPPLAIVMKELNELKLQISKKKTSYSKNKNAQQVPPNALQNRYKTQFKMNCDLCRQNNHLFENFY
nr:hypothetical protein [Tanacetum cinerariifolium]